ncbi:HIT family protein [Brevibacillus sp. SYP-B805]|uniref:HIT family protein n=1 Tax=Brevibacillus sp. SYP-B805 TaxID=1578199 RepID=UPI0013EA9A2A|nr:HIT family protein [Brevibacillus sp. SYP-B805]NGQ93855.1 HIT family protein [Brevibacillus sp. SYP-B805]
MKADREQKPLNQCYICAKHRGDIAFPGDTIYEDEFVKVVHASMLDGADTMYLGYLMVETKRHALGWAELSVEEAQAVGRATALLGRALKAVAPVEHVYSFVLGHHVPHFHLQIVPRYEGAPREYWGVKVTDWPEAPQGNEEDIRRLCERLREFLADHACE